MSCPKCNDTGLYKYDHNHSTVCDLCCKHDQGWWFLTEYYADSGKWCCRGGCGKTLTYQEVTERLLNESNHNPIFMDIKKSFI